MTRPTRATIAAACALAGALTLASCADAGDGMEDMDHGDTHTSDSTSGSDAETDANDADVMFAQMMIPHHEQAIEMSDIVLANPATTPEVAALAEQITAAQGPEIETLNAWLDSWGGADSTPMEHGEMGHGDGMMSEDDLEALAAAEGPAVNQLFLEQMVAHHEGAVAMAMDQVEDGQNTDAVALAQQMIDTQSAEITEMQELLAGLDDTEG